MKCLAASRNGSKVYGTWEVLPDYIIPMVLELPPGAKLPVAGSDPTGDALIAFYNGLTVEQQAVWNTDPVAIPGTPAPTGPATVATAPLWAVRAVLRQEGLFDRIDTFVESMKATNPVVWEAWNMGNIASADSTLIKHFEANFGLGDADIAALLTAANALQA